MPPFPNSGAPAPAATDGTATFYNPLSGCTSMANPGGLLEETGTGMGSQDFGFAEDTVGGGVGSGCFFFGGYFNTTGTCGNSDGQGNNPFFSYYMEMNTSGACGMVPGGVISTATACAATPNTTGVPGACEVVGDIVASNNDVIIRATGLPATPLGVFGIFLHGLTDMSANPISTGQGLLCIGSAGRFDQTGQIQQADAMGVAELSTVAGQFDLAALPIASAPFLIAATAGTTSNFGFWHRDFVVPAAVAFNFTGTCTVTWQ